MGDGMLNEVANEFFKSTIVNDSISRVDKFLISNKIELAISVDKIHFLMLDHCYILVYRI